MGFAVTLGAVALMLAYAVPGFLLVRAKRVAPSGISAFAAVLMYVCQPCLTLYAFNGADYSAELLREMGLFFLLSFVLQAAVMGVWMLLFRRRKRDVRCRVCGVAAAFGNCAFMGVPLLESILPGEPKAVLLAIVYFTGMSLLGWTAASAVITGDARHITVKKLILNPAVLSLVAAMLLFVPGIRLPGAVASAVTLLGRMTTPLCMLIMGMRLATVPLKPLFTNAMQYVAVAVKQLLFPLLGLAIIWFFPVAPYVRQTMFILCCCPVASVVLNFAELLGEGQDTAANVVLLGTSLSVVTVPLMLTLYNVMI